jgi:hypothetical protein
MTLAVLVLGSGITVRAQDIQAIQTLENLRQQLGEIHDREAGIKMRLDELEYDLKPENIERYFNGYGSTRPEELRERRRKQLQIEKDRLQSQQQELATRRSSLENAISVAQVQAYQQAAPGALSLQSRGNWLNNLFTFTRVLVGAIVLMLVLGSLALRLYIRRRRNV